MDRVAAGRLRDRDDLLDVEIGGRADAGKRARLVGLARMQRAGVVFGKDRDRADPQLGRGAHDADGDFAAVGDQKIAGKHGRCWDSSYTLLFARISLRMSLG